MSRFVRRISNFLQKFILQVDSRDNYMILSFFFLGSFKKYFRYEVTCLESINIVN